MKISIKSILLKSVLLFIILTTINKAELKAQCPMCKAAVESSMKDSKSTKGRGLNKGILYLLAMPYLLAGVTGAGYYIRNKKLKSKKSKIE